jgi:ABC-type amino acid transport substrate-binding protein
MASDLNNQPVDSTQHINIELTQDEQAFLEAHPVIRFGTDDRWEPYVIKKANCTIEGFDIDLSELINEFSCANIQIVTGPGTEMGEQAKELKIDGLADSAISEERTVFFNFSKQYVSIFPVFVNAGNSTLQIAGLDDFAGNSIAVLKGHQFYLNILSEYPSINVIESSSEIDAIKLVIEGKSVAAIVATTTYNNYNKMFGENIKIGYVATGNPLDLVYSIRKKWPELISIITKVLSALTPEINNNLFARGFGFSLTDFDLSNGEERIPLTASEQDWIKVHSEIRLGVNPACQPLEFLDKMGQHQEIASDYIRILNERLGINIKTLPNMSWSQLMEAIPQKDIDILSTLVTTPEREKPLNYTDPYLFIGWIIIRPENTPKINSLADFNGRTIAVVEGSATQDSLQQEHPEIHLLPQTTTLDVLQRVIDWKATAAVVERNTATMIMNAYRIYSLKIDQQIFKTIDLSHLLFVMTGRDLCKF